MLHVLQGTTSDSDEITRLIDEGGGDSFVTPWVVPKKARPGDDILIYYRHKRSIIERGEIVSIPEPDSFGKRNVYKASIKISQWLDPGITLDELSALFPEWAWLRYPRTYATPTEDIAEKLKVLFLERIESNVEEETPEDDTQHFYNDVSRSLQDSHSSRQARLAIAPEIPERISTTSTSFRRNPDVVAEVLLRAEGKCENCLQPAPFARASDRTPYLEVHHRVMLAAGGKDTVANAIALCPNCHRAAHYA